MKLPNWYVHDPPMVEDLLEALVGPKGRELPEKMGSIQELARASPSELQDHLTPVKALRLAATFRLIQALRQEFPTGKQIKRARDVFDLYQDRFIDKQQENFVVLLLDSKHRLMKELTVSVGSLSAAIVHPREVFAPAIKERAAALIVLHNHPSGDPTPSAEDFEITRRLKEVGDLVGIRLLDHVIVGINKFYSFQEGESL